MPGGPLLGPAGLLQLQRTAGNRAAVTAVQRYFKFSGPLDERPELTSGEVAAFRLELLDADFKEGSKELKSFDTAAKSMAPRFVDKWAEKNAPAFDWKAAVKKILKIDVDATQKQKDELFGKPESGKFQGGRLSGVPLSGFVPVNPSTKAEMLKQVPRSGADSYRYDVDEDSRVVQILRQISTQVFLYLTATSKLGEQEQEIQTMDAFGSLFVGSNVLETTRNFYDTLVDVSGSLASEDILYAILSGNFTTGKLGVISKRHGDKLQGFYDEVRQQRVTYPRVASIVDRLVAAKVRLITALDDVGQIDAVVKNPDCIYVVSAPSLKGKSHAEQRLIELRDIVAAYGSDPTAWVAGKKRPCFGCWIHETLAKDLIYQDQPGKAFMNTFMAATPSEREHWAHHLTDEDFVFHETSGLRGEVGPESESEAEDLPDDMQGPDELLTALGTDKLEDPTKKILSATSRSFRANRTSIGSGSWPESAPGGAASRRKTRKRSNSSPPLVTKPPPPRTPRCASAIGSSVRSPRTTTPPGRRSRRSGRSVPRPPRPRPKKRPPSRRPRRPASRRRRRSSSLRTSSEDPCEQPKPAVLRLCTLRERRLLSRVWLSRHLVEGSVAPDCSTAPAVRSAREAGEGDGRPGGRHAHPDVLAPLGESHCLVASSRSRRSLRGAAGERGERGVPVSSRAR